MYLWRANRRILLFLKGTSMSNTKQRSLERLAAVLASVYGIMKVCFDFYVLVRGH